MVVQRARLQVPRYLTPRLDAAPPQAELRDGLQAAALELRAATEVR